MAEEQSFRTTINSRGAVIVHQRPCLLIMVIRLRANEATLELGLAKLNERREAAKKWLGQLGVSRIEFSEPFFVPHADKDPAEQTLILFDRLRFETSPDTTAEAADENPSWSTETEQISALIAQLNGDTADDDSPEFLFISRINAEQMQKAITDLDDTSYNLDENEMVSDDPRSAAFNVNVNASYYLV